MKNENINTPSIASKTPNLLKTTGKILVLGGVIMVTASSYVWAQNGQWPPFGPDQTAEPLPPHQFEEQDKDGFRNFTSNGIPDHPTGKFPNRGNPNAIRAQNYKFRVPIEGKVALKKTQLRHGLFGIALSGVPFDPGTAEFWNNNRAWNYEALSGKINLGTDDSNAHVQPGGVYHYHGLPTALINQRSKKDQMTMLGYAADGFPIYANMGYSLATDTHSKLKKLRSSYRLKEGTRPSGMEGPGGIYDGSFTADWEYVAQSGDLDEYNGRTGTTDEFPKGTYYYVITDEFPFVPREFRGTPDSSFAKGPPGGGMGGRGGRGGPGGQFGPPPPGFGPPPPGFGPPPFEE